jgi:hypothetical protein
MKSECGMRSAECGIDRTTFEPRARNRVANSLAAFRIPDSALRILVER